VICALLFQAEASFIECLFRESLRPKRPSQHRPGHRMVIRIGICDGVGVREPGRNPRAAIGVDWRNQPADQRSRHERRSRTAAAPRPADEYGSSQAVACLYRQGRTADRGHRSPHPCADREGSAEGHGLTPLWKVRFGVRSTPCHSTNAETIGRPPDHAARSAHHRPGRCQPNERACCILAPSIGK
jgi:hypothetical protein